MTLPLETVGHDQLRLLVLTPDYTDFLWLNALLAHDPETRPDSTWCPDLVDCDDLIRNAFRQFHDRKMTETIFRIIFNADVDTSLLELELTESAMMHDPEYAKRCLRELSQLGISFALDD